MTDQKRKGNKTAPFSIYSSSVTDGYIKQLSTSAGITGSDITNLHEDGYGPNLDSGMQGPFAHTHVGGMQHRHINLNSGSDGEANRAEGFRITLSQSFGIRVRPAQFGSNDAQNLDLPSQAFFRDGMVKRPFNIQNIKWGTGSSNVGNYQLEREIVSVGSRTTNNPAFVRAGGYSQLSAAIDPFIEGVVSYTKPDRSRNAHTMVNRFSAPGGPETAGDANGGAGLDVEAAEFSPYNALPFRNLQVRIYGSSGGFRGLFASHSPQFGSNSSGVSFHKVQRNTRKRYVNTNLTGSTFVLTQSYDNAHRTRAIPSTDRAYAWITASFLTGPLGYASASDEFIFASSSNQDFSNPPLVTHTYRNDTIGLNISNYVPITSSENLWGRNDLNDGTAQGNLTTVFANPEMGGLTQVTPTDVQSNTAFFQEKFGVFGWPSWKQVRGGEHPVMRHQRKNNIWNIPQEYLQSKAGGFFNIQGIKRRLSKQFIEPVISKKNGVVAHKFKNKNSGQEFVARYSLTNNDVFFANEELNTFFGIWNEQETFYDKITKQYLKKSDSFSNLKTFEDVDFVSVKCKEKIWPNRLAEGLAKNRSRGQFAIQFWKTNRIDRTALTSSNSQGETISASSIWPMDARENFATGVSYDSYEFNNATLPTNSCGELQNPYGTFHNDPSHTGLTINVANLKQGALFNRRMPTSISPTYTVGGNSILGDPLFYNSRATLETVFAGDTFWEVPGQRGRRPFQYENYAEYANEMKNSGKGHSVIPEFRISEHIQNVIASGSTAISGFFSTFALTGSNLASTSSVFTNDLMLSDDVNAMVRMATEHDKFGEKELSISCEGLLKFLPYNGLFPASRTLQIAELFKNAFQDFVINSSSVGAGEVRQVYRNFNSMFFAPGILFNSIKSGIGVSYPYSENVVNRRENEVATSLVTDVTLVDTDDTSPLSTNFNWRTPTVFYPAWPRISSSVGSRRLEQYVPFEALFNPEKELLNKTIWDSEIHISASLDESGSPITKNAVADRAILKGSNELFSKLYRTAISNFMAETVKFFAPDGKLTSHISLPDSHPNFGNVDADKNEYIMDFVLYNTVIPQHGAYDFLKDPASGVPAIIYSNQAAFGVPVDLSYSTSGSAVAASCFAPFTPPYSDGASRVRFKFRPFKTNDTKYTLDEIFSNLELIQYRPLIPGEPEDAENGTWTVTTWEPSDKSEYVRGVAYRNKMMPSSSVNLQIRSKLKKVEFEALTGKPVTIQEPESGFNVWIIEQKWQSPAFDHSYHSGSITTPVSGAGALSRGVWHQYPRDINSSKGIYSQLAFGSMGDAAFDNTTGSLAELVGFDTTPKRIGDVANSKTVSEAIVAVPYYEEDGDRFYYPVDRSKIDAALSAQGVVGESVKDMVEKMQKFVLPPEFDFINDVNVDPFAMYFFDFQKTLSRQDLIDIWYNIAPKSHIDHAQKKLKIKHKLNDLELMSELKQNTKWIVFKVKQRAELNYFKLTSDQKDDERFQFQIGVERDGKQKSQLYGYNWPYDYFSIVELGKIDAQVKILSGSNE